MVLLSEDTRDEAMRWIAHRKEKRMYTVLDKLKKKIGSTAKPAVLKKANSRNRKQRTLEKYREQPAEGLKIFVDYREKESKTVRALSDMGADLELTTLKTADFVVSSRVGIEFKTVPDFVDSLVDGRLLNQVKELKRSYEQPLILVEGQEDIYAMRKVHANAIRGMMATIAVSYNVPIIFSQSPDDTTQYLLTISKREQESGPRDFSPHGSKKPISLKEQQEYLVSALPSIGPNSAKQLLSHFGSVESVFAASEQELKDVEGIGKKRARDIRHVLGEKYKSRPHQ